MTALYDELVYGHWHAPLVRPLSGYRLRDLLLWHCNHVNQTVMFPSFFTQRSPSLKSLLWRRTLSGAAALVPLRLGARTYLINYIDHNGTSTCRRQLNAFNEM